MGWRSTLVLIGLVLVAGAYLWFGDTPPARVDRAGPARDEPPRGEPTQALRKLLVFEPAAVVDVQLQRASRIYQVEQQNGSWQGIEDPSLVNDFLHTLSGLPVLMDISEPASAKDLADFGLDPPRGVIVLRLADQTTPLELQLGDRNPATTGVYARVGDSGTVVLAGALVEWEFDKLFKRLSAGG